MDPSKQAVRSLGWRPCVAFSVVLGMGCSSSDVERSQIGRVGSKIEGHEALDAVDARARVEREFERHFGRSAPPELRLVNRPGRIPAPSLVAAGTAESHRLTLQLLDRDGHPAASSFVQVTDLATAQIAAAEMVSGGTLDVHLPVGHYGVGAFIETPRPGLDTPSVTAAYLPAVALSADTTLDLDGRRGNRVAVSVDEPTARQLAGAVFASLRTAQGNVQFPMFPLRVADFERDELYAVPTQSSDGFTFYVQSHWSEEGASDSPYMYHLLSRTIDRVPDDPRYDVHRCELARVETSFAAQGLDWERGASTSWPTLDFVGLTPVAGFSAGVRFPRKRVDYYTPGRWAASVLQFDSDGGADDFTGAFEYPKAKVYQQRWNTMPLGPTLASASVSRAGDAFSAFIPMYVDSEVDHSSGTLPSGVTGTMTLRRGEEVIAESDIVTLLPRGVTLPPEPGIYELTSQGTRSVPWSRYATEQRVTWRFSSQHTDAPQTLPLMVVRYAIDLDRYGRTAAGRRSSFEVEVERSVDTRAAPERVSLSVSYDDGASWKPAALARHHDRWRATVRYPEDADFVSLRAVVVDAAGNSVEQEQIRAYGLSH